MSRQLRQLLSSCCLATCSLQHAACNFAPPNGNCQAAKCLPSLLFALIAADACALRPKYQSTRIVCPNYSGHSATHTHIAGEDKGSHPTQLGQNNNTTTRFGCCWLVSVGQGLTGLKLPENCKWNEAKSVHTNNVCAIERQCQDAKENGECEENANQCVG